MTPIAPPPEMSPDHARALVEQARHEAQDRVAELHVEEGTVQSEHARNSPHADDHD